MADKKNKNSFDDYPSEKEYYEEGEWQPTPLNQLENYEQYEEEQIEEYEEKLVKPRRQPRKNIRSSNKRKTVPETTEWEGNPAWQGMIVWYFKWFVFASIWTLLIWFLYKQEVLGGYWLALSTIVCFGGILGIGKLIRRATKYKVTNKAIYETRGIINTCSDHARLEEITNTRVTRTLFDRMLGVGTIDFFTAGERKKKDNGDEVLKWDCVKNPYHVQALVDGLRDEEVWKAPVQTEEDEGF